MPRRPGPAAGPAVEVDDVSRKKKLFHRFKRVQQGIVAARKDEVQRCNRGLKRLEAKAATDGGLSDALRAQLDKLRRRGSWLRELDGPGLARLCGIDAEAATNPDSDASAATPKISSELDPRQRGALQKLLDTRTVRERLAELRDEMSGDALEKRRAKRAVSDQPSTGDSDGSARGDGDEDDDDDDEDGAASADGGGGGGGGQASSNLYAHWATGDDGSLGLGGAATGDEFGDADGDFGEAVAPPLDDDGSGMFLSSLSSASGGGRAPPRVRREVFATVDVGAAADTQIGGKKRKNRPGQIARQKRAAKRYGEEAAHVRNPEKNAIARQEERRQKKLKRERPPKRDGRDKPKRNGEGKGGGKSDTPMSASRPAAAPAPSGAADADVHPSWAAKRQANAVAIQPFQGKRITFD